MPGPAHSPDADEPLSPLPQEFAAIMRPELPSLIKEIAAEVTRAYPEYARLLSGPYRESIRVGVEQNLTVFVDQVASPTASSTVRDEMCRRFGRFEAYEGRSLDTLQGAYRLGARVALRRAKRVGRRYNLSPALMLSFADALFAYVDQLESVTREGYLDVESPAAGERTAALRRRLLHLILAGSPVSRTSIADLADQAAWPLPESVTMVALPSRSAVSAGAFAGDVIADMNDPQPHLLIPGAVDDERRLMLDTSLSGTWACVGLTVPIGVASDSIRWARQLLELAESGAVAQTGTLYCEDHLVTLWLRSDPALLQQLAHRELAPLVGLTPSRRERLVDTLRIWMATRGTAARMGELLDVHPQTVRYRLRTLEGIFGDQLSDPDRRFATELVLRATALENPDR
ncbi:helix-turn-helix domain-containing protein [Streptomyces sp. NBC_00344]|uniref:PucR family transcriptional regulator n=1 Tax=Streptomyces sp. NBC_00344 TaxID=2975720 RepID=UPI002E1B6B33